MFLVLIIYLGPFLGVFHSSMSFALNTGEILEFHDPSDCAADEYFDITQLKCITCDSDSYLIPSSDGFFCTCNHRSKIKIWNFATFPVCELCKDNEMPTKDQMDCIFCPGGKTNRSVDCDGFQCSLNEILIDRASNGTLLEEAYCMKCNSGTELSSVFDKCVPCKNFITSKNKNCTCDESQLIVDNICLPNDSLKNWPNEKSTYLITYDNEEKVDSKFLRENLHRGLWFCKMGNQTACQLVANMCAMILYKDDKKSSPCSIFADKKRVPTSSDAVLPWIYYGEGEAPTVLSRKKISVQFDLNSHSEMSYLNLTGVVYHPKGSFKEIKNVFQHTLQLCPGSWKLDSSLRFASKYSRSCKIPAQQLLTKETEFIDLYLRYREAKGEVLYAIPVLVLNIKNEGSKGNEDKDRIQWQLVRRFFLVDKISGISFDESQNWNDIPKVTRYAESLTLKVKLIDEKEKGKIFVPYLEVQYKEFTREEAKKGKIIFITFKIDFEMENNLSHVLELCIGIFSGLAILWSGIQTWSHTKRSGKVAIDFVTIAQLLIFACGNLANVFFFVVFCACVNFFIFFKGQNAIHLLLPREDQETMMKFYIASAFFLKLIEIGQLIFNQITIDIFFIDWERPRAINFISRTSCGNLESQEEQPVSIWRTYFVANEWNEIQTKRKLNIFVHLLLTVFFLKVIKLENLAIPDQKLKDFRQRDENDVGFNFTCLFAVGGIVYLTTYIVQRFYMTFIYERYIKNGIQEFVDVCSMANISVFILALENYGFYIHGRSAHGFADTDMQSIINQLQREEEDLVGHRGLLPGTDQQTFEMTVPVQLRAYYKKVMAPLKNMSQNVKRFAISTVSERSKIKLETVDKSVQAYRNMKRFLAAFLEHALKDLDYEVKEKIFVESLLDIEFADNKAKGVFYSDNGHSFDSVLFYGNEFSLLTFDIYTFSFVLLLSEDYLIAGTLTAVMTHLLSMMRNIGGRKNLAKKTLIDQRFLV